MSSNFITIRVKGYAGPGWEIQCTGSPKWVEKTIKAYIPRVKKIALMMEGPLVVPNDLRGKVSV